MKYRMVRVFNPDNPQDIRYRVETAEALTQKEALALLRDLGSPYKGRVYEDRPEIN